MTNRLRFLDILQELVYGEKAPRVKERTQLHRLIEAHCWMFGPKYHLASSDQQFRTVINRHRELAGMESLDEGVLSTITGIDNIPDLFLAAQRDFPADPPHPSHHRLLVELKRPSVSVGLKEVDQAKKYARSIGKSTEFDQRSTHWEVFVVSSKIVNDMEDERNQKGRPHGCVADYENVTVFAYTWGEVIEKARDDMKLVRQHLEHKSLELNVSDYLRQNFPDIVLGES